MHPEIFLRTKYVFVLLSVLILPIAAPPGLTTRTREYWPPDIAGFKKIFCKFKNDIKSRNLKLCVSQRGGKEQRERLRYFPGQDQSTQVGWMVGSLGHTGWFDGWFVGSHTLVVWFVG